MTKIVYINLKILFSVFICFTISCSNRAKDNPFDPNGNSPSPVSLTVFPENDKALLTWSVKNIRDFNAFRLYRSVNNSAFELFREMPPSQTTFADSTISLYHWYRYRVSMLGGDSETKPSQTVKVMPGPGNIYILSRYGYSISHISYDLQHIKEIYYTSYPAINWDWSEDKNIVWMAHAQFRNVSRLNLSLGYEDFYYENHLSRPIDIEFAEPSQRIYILDDNKNRIYILHSQAVTDSVILPSDHFFKILTTPHSDLFALDSTMVLYFSPAGILRDSIPLSENVRAVDMVMDDHYLYFIANHTGSSVSSLFHYNLLEGTTRQFASTGMFQKLTKPANKNYFWATERINLNSYRCVKLSLEGQRLLELNSLNGIIDDIQINPYDFSVIAVQRYQNNIVLYDSLGNQLATGNSIYDPIKAFVY